MLSLKDQWCWYHVSTRPAASLSRDPDDLKMHRAVNLLHLARFELAARFLVRAPAFLNMSGNCGSPTSQGEPFSTLVKRSFSCQGCRVTFLCLPDLFEHDSCLLYVVHQLSGKQNLGVLPDGWGSLGLEGASWHPQPHLPDWDPIPNLPVALTQSHFMYVCWISFQRAAKAKYALCMFESSRMF